MLNTLKQESGSPKPPLRNRALALARHRHDKRLGLKPRSFLSVDDLTADELQTLIRLAIDMKLRPLDYCAALRERSVALIFQKTSTRTRCSFENAAVEMGAHASYIDWRTSNLTLADLADEIVCLSRYYDLIAARVLQHATLQTMTAHSEVPVINAMCDTMHPCQALGDYMTLTEYFGDNLAGLHLAYIGDGNNVCRSLAQGAALLGVYMSVCAPPAYALDPESRKNVTSFDNPFDAVAKADVIYTDTWVSIGQEPETEKRLQAFRRYQVDETLFRAAPDHALFMHCLPAHPGYEVTPGILRGPRSIVFDQAENRKHAQKALMKKLLTPNNTDQLLNTSGSCLFR